MRMHAYSDVQVLTAASAAQHPAPGHTPELSTTLGHAVPHACGSKLNGVASPPVCPATWHHHTLRRPPTRLPLIGHTLSRPASESTTESMSPGCNAPVPPQSRERTAAAMHRPAPASATTWLSALLLTSQIMQVRGRPESEREQVCAALSHAPPRTGRWRPGSGFPPVDHML